MRQNKYLWSKGLRLINIYLCSFIESGVDVSRITLSKNGSPVKQDDRCKLTLGTDSCILNISSASLDDDGVYTISISGSEVTGCQIKVKVIAIKER